jgi:hypothetical protein
VLLKLTKQESWEFEKMSVTFYFEKDEEETETNECDCEDTLGRVGSPTCKICRGKGFTLYTRGLHECNFSNSNAFRLMTEIMDVEDFDYAGEMEPELMLKHIREAKIVHSPSTLVERVMHRRLDLLEQLAEAARDAGDLIRWG